MCLSRHENQEHAAPLRIALHDQSGFEQIFLEFEHLEQLDGILQHVTKKSVTLAVREVRVWTLSEILDVLHQREENEWMRLGRLRIAREKRLEKRARKPRTQRKRCRAQKS